MQLLAIHCTIGSSVLMAQKVEVFACEVVLERLENRPCQTSVTRKVVLGILMLAQVTCETHEAQSVPPDSRTLRIAKGRQAALKSVKLEQLPAITTSRRAGLAVPLSLDARSFDLLILRSAREGALLT